MLDLNNNHYEYIDYLINSGENVPSFVFFQPYQVDHFFYDQPGSSLSYNYFKSYWDRYYGKKNIALQLLISDRMVYHEQVLNRFKITWGGHFITPNITLANNTVIDQEYKYDPAEIPIFVCDIINLCLCISKSNQNKL